MGKTRKGQEGLSGVTLGERTLVQVETARKIAEYVFPDAPYLRIRHLNEGRFSEVDSVRSWGPKYQIGTLPFSTYPWCDIEATVLYAELAEWEPIVAQWFVASHKAKGDERPAGFVWGSLDPVYFSRIFDFHDNYDIILREGLVANTRIAQYVSLNVGHSLFRGLRIACNRPSETYCDALHDAWPRHYEIRTDECGVQETVNIPLIMTSVKDLKDVEVTVRNGKIVSQRSADPVIEILSSPLRLGTTEKEYRALTLDEILKIVEQTAEAYCKAKSLLTLESLKDDGTPTTVRFNLPQLLAWSPRTVIEARFGVQGGWTLAHQIRHDFCKRHITESVEVFNMPDYPGIHGKILVRPKDPNDFALEFVAMYDQRVGRKIEGQYADGLAAQIVQEARKYFQWVEVR